MTDSLIALRRQLHGRPELSDHERGTAEHVQGLLRALHVDEVLTDLGGHGVAARIDSAAARESGGATPTALFRCELDALPIQETSSIAHCSRHAGVAHACGHDGHMAILTGLAERLTERRPERGRAVLVYQPAEETGEGARRVAAEPRFRDLAVQHAFALHNLPGEPLGSVIVRSGTFTCASRGLVIELRGATSHAAHPELGKSPAPAVAELLTALPALAHESEFATAGLTMVTVVHARLGEIAFGTSPGEAVVMATLRAERDDAMTSLVARAEQLARNVAERYQLEAEVRWRDVFAATCNDEVSVERVREAARAVGAEIIERPEPIRWSEDFGALAASCPHAAMFGLGAGVDQAPLHASDYDFPDALIERGVALFEHIARGLLG